MSVAQREDMSVGPLVRLGLSFARWSEKWFPDPLVFALIAVVLVFVLAVISGESASVVAVAGGKSFWALVPFTMQMAMVVIGGYVVASAPVVRRGVDRLAMLPANPRSAIAMIALFSMFSSLLSWGVSLIFSAQLVRAVARRLPRLDYRAAGAAAYLGLGVSWALGLSSSAAMMMATSSSLPKSLIHVSGVIPLQDTLFTWQNGVMAGAMIALACTIAMASAPRGDVATTAADLGIDLTQDDASLAPPTRPAEWLEHSPLLSLGVAALLGAYLVHEIAVSPKGALAVLDLNTYNLIFLTVGLMLHWRPASFLKAVTASIPATGGVLIQFPFYAMVFGMITDTGLSERIAGFFAGISTHETYPLLVATYSSLLGVFIPSGGSKWIIEAPYLLQAAQVHQVNLGWVVQIYNAAEALPNLINPFWMLPMLGILKCRARDLVGYGMLQLLILLPAAYVLCWALARTF